MPPESNGSVKVSPFSTVIDAGGEPLAPLAWKEIVMSSSPSANAMTAARPLRKSNAAAAISEITMTGGKRHHCLLLKESFILDPPFVSRYFHDS